MPVPVASKRHVHYPVLVYHGCVRTRADVLTFREHFDDFAGQVRHLLHQGYTFVSPSDYLAWYNGATNPISPIACIHIDDGLASISVMCDWLVEQGIPFGLAIIGRRQRKHEPEPDFAGWETLRGYVDTGLCELINHTYNHHHLIPVYDKGIVQSGPVMSAPAWVDVGDPVHVAPGDTRPAWDFSHVDSIALGLPLYGSDPFDNFATPITTTLRITPKWSGNVTTLRLWQALGRPFGTSRAAGYDANVRIDVRPAAGSWTQVWFGTISPTDYGTRSQWVEREFYSITLATPFSVTSGTPIEIRFTTLNAGYGCAVIYLIPDFSGQYWAVTTTRALSSYPEPVPDEIWPIITDFPAGYPWPGRPAIILASGGGSPASDAEYQAYIQADLEANNTAIQTWLRADWTTHSQAYVGNADNLGTAELAGSDVSGAPITTRIPYDCPASHVAEVLRWRNAGPSGDERYTNLIEIALSTTVDGPWTVLATYASRWRHYKWEEVDIPPTPLVAGTRYWVRFRSLIANPWGRRAVQRILIDRVTDLAADAEWPQGVHAYLETLSATPGAAPAPNQLAYPFGSYMDNGAGSVVVSKTQDVGAPLQAALVAAGCDMATTIYPARYEPATGLFREPGARYSRYTLGRHLIYGTAPPLATLSGIDAYAGTRYADAPHGGIRWQTSVEPDPAGNATVRHSVAALDWVSFDAWFFDGAGGIARGALNDGGTYLGITPLSGTFTPGETLTESGSGATASLVWAEPTIGVMRVTGVSGAWTGGATVTGGTSGATAIGDIPGPTPYADDKGWLQARGVRCLLILNNNLATGAPDSAIGSHVVNNPSTYIPQIVAAAVDNGWDGITCNLEAVPAADRAAASAFYAQLAAALHAQRKHLIATAPATTGTDYDADWWTGWCDHNALAAVCDAVKILTYTETGPGTAPGSASPDWHFEATVEYLRYHVYAPLWPRLLLGARAFGHLWADRADPNSADYVTYADALAQGMLLGAEIQQADGEGYWRQGARECWFGSPETIRRAVRRASAIGFGGVGIWKADDGDLYEHWPEWPQIGVDDMAAFSEERFPDDWAWFAVGGPRYKTYITAGDSDYEARVGVGDLGLRRYTLSRELHTQAEVDFFLSFWQLRRGPLEGFRLRDWRDYTATGQGLGVGDGLLTGFQLVKRYANTDPVTGASSSYQRTITKPRPGTVQVYLDGVQQSSGYTVDHATGLISFSTPPASGVTVTASCEFDVPVRFEQDEPPLQFDPQFGLAQLSGLRLVEVRP